MERISGGQGRKKIPMKKIENQSSLDVTFSKRRWGMFKKATELSILCGCQVGVILFSAIKKVYSFGHTSLALILNRFIPRGNMTTLQDSMLPQGGIDNRISELDQERVQYESIIKAEKAKAINDLQIEEGECKNSTYWWGSTPEEGTMTMEETENMVADLDKFMKTI